VHYEHPPIASLLIGAALEADLVSPGFKQSTAISNHSTLDFTLYYDEQRIVLPDDASWKRLCSSSVPPEDDETTLAATVMNDCSPAGRPALQQILNSMLKEGQQFTALGRALSVPCMIANSVHVHATR